MTKRFKGKLVLITGAAAGLGRALALGFTREGVELVLLDDNQVGLEETVEQLSQIGAASSV